ncbi:MAG: O-acetyl-ADP-ribose deacetylase [Planctomycetota bacterium]
MPTSVEFLKGDITKVAADAIVNAANSRLAGGGGVDGAIHRAGGPRILEECRRIGHCPTGSAVATTAGNLPARYVFHAVGPVYAGREKDVEQLASCHLKCLDLAVEKGCRSIALPAISTGAYGYPLHEAAAVATGTVKGWLLKNPDRLERILFVLFSDDAYEAYRRAWARRER